MTPKMRKFLEANGIHPEGQYADELVPYLEAWAPESKASQAQQLEIEKLKAKVAELESSINKSC